MIQVTSGDNSFNQTSGTYQPYRAPWHNPMRLGWNNCWAFGNGVESDRVRDDYNAAKLDNGVKASTTLAEPYSEEIRANGMIFSGIFNSTSGINNTNQFIQAEPITKDLNPTYGPIQKLLARNTDTLVFCEDKVLRVLTNKDALFNADGNSNVTATNKVLGAATPIAGDFGISKNPESLVTSNFGVYWVDQMRGQVLKMTGGNITPISEEGMKDWFSDNLVNASDVLGTWDANKDEYNVTIGKKVWKGQLKSTKTTLSYSERAQGWTSFKSFPFIEWGTSLNGEYYSFYEGNIYQHHQEVGLDGSTWKWNNFHGSQYESDITVLFNDQPGSVKSFGTINYEGSKNRITEFKNIDQDGVTYNDGEYYNLNTQKGWYCKNLITNLQDTGELEFKNKEDKYFSSIKGVTTTTANLDEREFSVQGLGTGEVNDGGDMSRWNKFYVMEGSLRYSDGTNWDVSSDSTNWRVHGISPTAHQTNSSVSAGSVIQTIDNLKQNTSGVWVYSGYDLDAAHFEVPGGTPSTSGTGNNTIYIYTAAAGWNADTTFSSGNNVASGITKVEFSNIGIAGDAGNTVRLEIFYAQIVSFPNNDLGYYVDVDNDNGTGDTATNRLACFKVVYNTSRQSSGTATVGQTAVDGLLSQNVSATYLNSTTHNFQVANKHSGTVTNNQTSLVAEYEITVTDSTQDRLVVQSNGHGADASYHSHSGNTAWAPYYTYVYTDTMNTATGHTNKIESTNIKVYYTPPVGITGLDPDPTGPEGGDFCDWDQCIVLDYDTAALTTKSTTHQRVTHAVATSNSVTGDNNSINITTTANGYAGVRITYDDSGTTYYYSTTIRHGGDPQPGTWTTTPTTINVLLNTGTNNFPIDLPAATTTQRTFSYGLADGTAVGSTPGLVLTNPNTSTTTIPTIASPATFTQQALISTTVTMGAKTNATCSAGTAAMQAFSCLPNATNLSLIKSINVQYTAATNYQIAINSQPNSSHLSGAGIINSVEAKNALSAGDGTAGEGRTLLHVAPHVGLQVGQSIYAPTTTMILTADAASGQADITVVEADGDLLAADMPVTGTNIPANTKVVSVATASGGNRVVTLNNNLAYDLYTGTNFIQVDIVFQASTTIASVGAITGTGAGAYQEVELSSNVLSAISIGDVFPISNNSGWSFSHNLVATPVQTQTMVEILQTDGSSYSPPQYTLTTVNNQSVSITGNISLASSGATAQNITINPDFLTVSAK